MQPALRRAKFRKQMSMRTKDSFSTKSSMLLHFLKGCVVFFALGIIFTWALALAELVNPRIIGMVIDEIKDQDPNAINHLLPYALWVIGNAALAAVFRYLYGVMNAKGGETLVKNMRDGLYDHILRLPYAWFSKERTGDIIQRCTSDVDTIKRFLAEELTSLLRTVVMIVLAVFFMLRIDLKLTGVSVIFIPIIVGYSLIFHKQIGDAFLKVDTEEGVLSAIAQENLTGVRVVRAFGREAYEKNRFMTQNENYTGMWVRMMQILSRFWATLDMLSGLQILTVLSLGVVFTVKGTITAGQYVSFVSYNAMLTWPVRNLGRILADMSKAGISIERIRYIMNSPIEQDSDDAQDMPDSYDIDFEHVSFGYDGQDVLKDISLHIKEGQTVGILGKTGSGKSTLIKLLDGLYDLEEDKGTIKIGGTDIKDIKHSSLRRNVGLVLQEPFLFSGTLSENIAITLDEDTDKDILDAQIKEAASFAHLDGAIEKFAKKYETVVGERGVTLSGGQKQRTAIASMLIRKTPIMIFDDSMSAVDTATDAAIRKSIREQKNDSTVILISHRITTLMMADVIFVVDKGRIAEQGTHEELLSKNGLYRKIYDLQRPE